MSYSATEVVKGWPGGVGIRYLLVCIITGVGYCACGCVDSAGRVGVGNAGSRGETYKIDLAFPAAKRWAPSWSVARQRQERLEGLSEKVWLC